MSQTQANLLWEALIEDIRRVVREEIRAALDGGNVVNKSRSPASSYLTITQAAEASSLAPSTIRLLIRKGRFKAHHVGRRVLIKRDDLERFLESRPTRIIID